MKSRIYSSIFLLVFVICSRTVYAEGDTRPVEQKIQESSNQAIEGSVKKAQKVVIATANKISEQPGEVAENVKELYAEIMKIWMRLPKWARYSAYGALATAIFAPAGFIYLLGRVSEMPQFKKTIEDAADVAAKKSVETGFKTAQEMLENDLVMAPLYDAALVSVVNYFKNKAEVVTRPAAAAAKEYLKNYWAGTYGWL